MEKRGGEGKKRERGGGRRRARARYNVNKETDVERQQDKLSTQGLQSGIDKIKNSDHLEYRSETVTLYVFQHEGVEREYDTFLTIFHLA